MLRGLELVGPSCHAGRVVPSAEEIARVPAENISVARAEFGAVWTAAERMSDVHPRDWALAGVCITCRWVALAVVKPPTGPWYLAFGPVSLTERRAYPELIEAESLAAAVQAIRRPEWLMAARPGWVDAVDATFAWLWRGTASPPVTVERTVDWPAAT